MRAFNCLSLLFAVSLSEALRSPHEKAKNIKRSEPLLTRDAPRARDTSIFLTNSTSSKLRIIKICSSRLICSQNSQSMEVHFLRSTSISAKATQELCQSPRIQTTSTPCGFGSFHPRTPRHRKKLRMCIFLQRV